MKKILSLILILCSCSFLFGCNDASSAPVIATTKPVYCFASALCEGTALEVKLLISENVSCLHDYTLQVSQMQKIENAELIIINGAGFEEFLADVLPADKPVLDSSEGIDLLCGDHHHEEEHHHEGDPHIWLSITNAKQMSQNIASGLIARYPQYASKIAENHDSLLEKFNRLELLAQELDALPHRDLITFHDGFSYLAEAFDLHILKAIEEESGSEASAQELIQIIQDIKEHNIPAIFTEVSGATSAADIIHGEANVKVYALDMALSELDYFEAMEYNIKTLKEALK